MPYINKRLCVFVGLIMFSCSSDHDDEALSLVLMDASEDNWVNWVVLKTFRIE